MQPTVIINLWSFKLWLSNSVLFFEVVRPSDTAWKTSSVGHSVTQWHRRVQVQRVFRERWIEQFGKMPSSRQQCNFLEDLGIEFTSPALRVHLLNCRVMTATSPCYKAAYIFTLQSTLTWQTILRIDNICKLGRNMVSEKVKFTVGASTWDWNACEMAIFCLWNISRIFETCTTSRSQWYTHNISCVNLVKKLTT